MRRFLPPGRPAQAFTGSGRDPRQRVGSAVCDRLRWASREKSVHMVGISREPLASSRRCSVRAVGEAVDSRGESRPDSAPLAPWIGERVRPTARTAGEPVDFRWKGPAQAGRVRQKSRPGPARRAVPKTRNAPPRNSGSSASQNARQESSRPVGLWSEVADSGRRDPPGGAGSVFRNRGPTQASTRRVRRAHYCTPERKGAAGVCGTYTPEHGPASMVECSTLAHIAKRVSSTVGWSTFVHTGRQIRRRLAGPRLPTQGDGLRRRPEGPHSLHVEYAPSRVACCPTNRSG